MTIRFNKFVINKLSLKFATTRNLHFWKYY